MIFTPPTPNPSLGTVPFWLPPRPLTFDIDHGDESIRRPIPALPTPGPQLGTFPCWLPPRPLAYEMDVGGKEKIHLPIIPITVEPWLEMDTDDEPLIPEVLDQAVDDVEPIKPPMSILPDPCP